MGAGANVSLCANAANTENVPTAIIAQTKIVNGHGRIKSRVGSQLNLIFPSRGGVRGCKGDGRPAFSRVRLSQKTFSTFVTLGKSPVFTGLVSDSFNPPVGILSCAVTRAASGICF